MTSPGLIDEGSFMHCSPYFVLMGCNPHWPEFEWPQHDHNGHQYVMECHHTAKKEQIVTHTYYVSLTFKNFKTSINVTKITNWIVGQNCIIFTECMGSFWLHSVLRAR